MKANLISGKRIICQLLPSVSKTYRILLFASLIALIGIGLWLFLRIAGMYYQTQGSELLRQAWADAYRDHVDEFACQLSPVTTQETLARIDHAILLLKKSLTYDRNISQTALSLGRAYCLRGDFEKAVEHYLGYIRLRPENPLGHLELGFAYEAICRRENTTASREYQINHSICSDDEVQAKLLTEWQVAGITAQELIARGNHEFYSARHPEAILWYARAKELGAQLESSVWYSLSLAYKSLDDEFLAEQALKQAVSLDSGWSNSQTRFTAWFEWGNSRLFKQEFPEAQEALEKALEISSRESGIEGNMSELHRLLGGAQWGQGKLKPALDRMKEAIALDYNNAWAHIHYGKILYALDPEQVEEVQQQFIIAIEIQSDQVETLANLVAFWRNVGQSEAADELCLVAKPELISDEMLKTLCRQ